MKVIVVGAGASGLMAAYELARKGVEVTMLEAGNRIGGRIHTFVPPGFVHEVEAGAEFIHGDLPLTTRLMKKAGFSLRPATGKMYRAENGVIKSRVGEGKGWDAFYEKLEKVRRDMTLAEFVAKYFSDSKYSILRSEVFSMAQGLDLADPAKVSIIGLKREWLSDEPQFRPQVGYGKLLEFLYDEAVKCGAQLHLDQSVSKIKWQKGAVEVFVGNVKYNAEAVLLTLPVPLMRQSKITFEPNVDTISTHYKSIGFGSVIKFSIEFTEAFWETEFPDLGFLFTEGGITLWTQLSEHKPLLTGWIGDGYTQSFKSIGDDALLEIAIGRLQECFPSVSVSNKFRAGAVFRFTEDSPSGGGYSWLMPQSKKAISLLNKGIENTIWFAGEALRPGGEPGTVEAALRSGRYAARKIALSFKR